MARFRKARRARSSGFRKMRRARRRGSSSGAVKPIMLGAILYGGLREKLSTALAPYTSKIPLGTLSDEVGMGLISYIAAKKGSGMIKDIGMKGLVIENARLGEALVSGNIFSTGSAQSGLFNGGGN